MRLLVVEDDPKMARMLQRGLTEEGHQVDVCDTAAAGTQQAIDVPYDVVLLDWGLPDGDGVSVVRTLRARGVQVSVLLLTARGTTGEKVTGLRAGADDYLVKPFAFEELLARLEALDRRSVPADRVQQSLGDLQLDLRRRVMRRGDVEVTLTSREVSLLMELRALGGDSATRSRLLLKVWGGDFEGTGNVVDVYVGYLRAKLERVGCTRVKIEAVRGVGYRLVVTA